MKTEKLTTERVRQAVLKNHGGLGDLTDEQVMRIWTALPPKVQERYLSQPAANTQEKK
jgi:hypothetical protein